MRRNMGKARVEPAPRTKWLDTDTGFSLERFCCTPHVCEFARGADGGAACPCEIGHTSTATLDSLSLSLSLDASRNDKECRRKETVCDTGGAPTHD